VIAVYLIAGDNCAICHRGVSQPGWWRVRLIADVRLILTIVFLWVAGWRTGCWLRQCRSLYLDGCGRGFDFGAVIGMPKRSNSAYSICCGFSIFLGQGIHC